MLLLVEYLLHANGLPLLELNGFSLRAALTETFENLILKVS